MAKETVFIGCRLPNGILLTHPTNPEIPKVKLEGQYQPMTDSGVYYPPRPYGMTVVDAEFWAAWKAAYQGYPPLKNRAIFEAKTVLDLEAKSREMEKEKTGFEGAVRNAPADGVRTEKG